MARPSSAEIPSSAPTASVICRNASTAPSVSRSSSIAFRKAASVRDTSPLTVPPVPHPRPCPIRAPGPFADHRLALVVREHEIEPAAVDVERGAEVLVRHRVAFDVPTGAALPPRARPRGFVLLGPFPEGEVERILPAAPRGDRVHDDVLDLPMGEDPEGMFCFLRSEIDLAVDRVCVATVDEPLHERDDLGDVLCDLRIMGRGL